MRKWKRRSEVNDRPHCPHRLSATLSPAQGAIVVGLRRLLLLPLDDLLALTREFIHPKVSRSGLDRCLRRHGVSNLKDLIPREEETRPTKAFKEYVPGFVHIDVKYLPSMPDEERRRYLFVAIDRATRWVCLELLPNKSARTSQGFLRRLLHKVPFKIHTILTDNGKEFTDRFTTTGERTPTGKHPFDQLCQAHGIGHRLIRPRHPQTNGMAERFNGRISEVLAATRSRSSEQLEQTLLRYAALYNQAIPQKNLGHITPIQALKEWYAKSPELFNKKVYNLTGLDT